MTQPDPPAGGQPGPPSEESARRLAERRLLDEIARDRRREREQLARLKWGCISVVAVLFALLVLGFVFS